MHAVTFPCPHCVIPLRVREREFVGRTVTCPECNQSVTIAQDHQGELFGVATEEGPHGERGKRRSGTGRWTPALAGWIVAGCLLVGLTMLLMRPAAESSSAAVAPGAILGDEPEATAPAPPAATEETPVSIDEQLAEFHGVILPQSKTEDFKAFPIGTVGTDGLPVPQRFSWIAALSALRDPDGPQPQWDRGWDDPANERFVRRRQPWWLNPTLEQVVGEKGYPATHFAGVAGVGADAAELPVEHPRAGIFGNDRRVGVNDVRDGLSNTMLIAGVEERLGSWAAGGDATVRGLTAEPYVAGPDGFGTGEADGMHVLMADGSVRFLSDEMAPTIVRRIAAMNDGLPLDPQVSGEPGAIRDEPDRVVPGEVVPDSDAAVQAARTLPAEAAQVIADFAGPGEMPIDVLLAEPPVVYDVEAALRQPILEFTQKDPVPVRDLLRLVEEMAAVPIRLEMLGSDSLAALDEPMTLLLSDVTIGDILSAALQSAGLTFESRPEGIFLRSDEALED